MLLHYWVKTNRFGFIAYYCGWCGLVKVVPSIVQQLHSIKPDDDNFDITCALSQDEELGSKGYFELHECPVSGEKRKRFNKAIDDAEACLLAEVV